MSFTKQRLLQVFEEQSIKITEVVKKISVSPKYFYTKSAVGSDKLEKIASEYPSVNMHWVITGLGEMLLSNPKHNYMDENFEVQWKDVPVFLEIYLQIAIENGLKFDTDSIYYSPDKEKFNTIIHHKFYKMESDGKKPEYSYKLLRIIKEFSLMVSYAIGNNEFTDKVLNDFKVRAIDMFTQGRQRKMGNG